MPFVDSRHLFSTLDFFTLDSRHFYSRLSTFLLSTLDFLVSTLVFYSRLSTFTLDPRQLLSTLDIYSRLSTIEIIDIECVLGHESCLHFFRKCPFKSAMLNLTRS